MTISNIYIVFGSLIWLYALVCLLLRLHSDRRRLKKEAKRRSDVRRFFCDYTSKKTRKKIFRHICRYVRRDGMLDYLCSCYIKSAPDFSGKDRELIDDYMLNIIHQQIAGSTEDPGEHCLILNEIFRCGLESQKILEFTERCRSGSPLERELIRRSVARLNIIHQGDSQ